MKKKISAGFLALVFLLQAFLPSLVYANQANPQDTKIISEETKGPDNVVTIGKLKGVGFSQDNPTASISIEEVEEKNHKDTAILDGLEIGNEIIPQALRSSGSPYIKGQQPADPDKPKYWANVQGELTTRGIDGTTFDWDKVLGKDQKVKLLFTQTNGNVMTGVTYSLLVDKDGTYTWQGNDGKPTYLPLFDVDGNPYTYNVQIERNYDKNVQLIIQESNGTPKAKFRQEGDKQVATISFLDIGIQQVASTKFVSEWHTALAETDRPQIEGYFEADTDVDNDFNFPKNDTTRTILRSSFVENFVEDETNGPWSFLSSEIEKTPKTVEVKTDTQGLTFEEKNGVKTVKSGDHKFKYDFTYDVINGGKLTMTEILPVTFDANGGKFKNFTTPDTETKIVKEVEYDGTLTDKAEDPTKDRETFKGWGTKDAQGNITPVTDEVFKNVKEAKTFYAIWDNNDIVADQLVVKESFKDGDTWVNDFIPTLETLKGQIKIKDASGVPQPLTDGDTLQILDDSGNPIADAAALKTYLYDKLKEDPNTEVSRDVTVKAKVIRGDGISQEVTIPIKVIKNIYEAKTEEGKPNYVPNDYVKVTVDPTTKAEKPQKYFYYVNPKAEVVIPGTDPVGVDGNTFTKWLIDGTDTEYKLKDKPRHKFENETTIKAQYSKDVIPQEGDTKPEGTPDNFVKVTFVPTENGTMEGAKIFWVNPEKEVTIPVENPVGKQYFTFKEWKLGADANGETYNPSTPKKFTEATTITATYTESDNIIPFDPTNLDDPKVVRPEGYVKITFEAEKGLKLTEQKAYYVKKNAGITLGNAELVKPKYSEDTGYKFNKWDKEDSLVIEAADIIVTAKATKLDNVIPEKKEDGTPNEKPEGYKEVTFVIKTGDETKGSIDGVAKFYVNPTEYVKINPPTTKANTGFEFGAWDKDATISTVYDKDTTITGNFNGLKDIIPKTNPDGTGNKQPAGYKTVTFVIDPATGGKIVDGEVTVYYVNPAKEVTVPQPKTTAETGYEFKEWDQDTVTTAKKYTADTTVKGNFKKLDDIIPSTDANGDPNAKPEGYVTVTFDKGANGKSIEGQTVYYVNPKADPAKTLGDQSIVKPTIKAEVGYKFTSWNFADTKEILSDLTVIAQYTPIDDVIPKTKDDESDKPEGYITVTFVKGDHGKELTGQAVYYVNPNKAVVLKDKAPTAVPNTGYKFADWDTQIAKKIQYSDGDKITALYNEIGDVIPQEKTDGSDKPAGYVTVTFLDGGHGTLSGKTVYYVNPNKEVTVPAPTVKPSVGFEFDKWDKALTQTFTQDTTIKAEYKTLADIIPQEKTDGSDKPDGYITVTFKVINGTTSGQTVFYVNGEKEIDLTNTANGISKKANIGYTDEGVNWSPAITNKKYTDAAEYTFTFKPLADVIEKTDENTKKPDGYVTVEFIAGVNGKLVGGNKTYYVNPTKNIKVGSTNLPIPKPQANNGYKFLRWAESIDENEVINGNKKFEAIFIPIAKYPDNPNPDNPDNPDRPDYPQYPDNRPGYSGLRTVYIEKPVEKVIKVPDNAYVKEVRYMQGYMGDFRPKDGLTRAEAAQILANALVEDGYKYNPNFKLSYKDIGEAWYTRAVKIVTEAKVFAGYDDGNFKPEDKITRNEWIATLKRFQELGDVSGNHMKLKDGHWAMGEIEAAYKEGWLKIYTDGLATYEGDKFIPREEVAAVSNKAFKRILDKTYIRNNEKNLISYKDVKKDMWSYEDILCASNTFLYKKDLYRAHWIKEDNNEFNINTDGFEIVKAKFQRNPR